MIHLLVLILLCVGMFFILVAAIGFIRLPDLFSRLHVTGILDSFGVPVVLLAVAVQIGPSLTAGKILLMIVLLYVTCPLIGLFLARAAMDEGHLQLEIKDVGLAPDSETSRGTPQE